MKKTARALCLALVLALVLSMAGTAMAFSDTGSHWASREIDKWSKTDILSGYPDGSFNPDGTITRAELFKIAAVLMGYTEQAENTFTDLASDAWYAPYILRLAAAGVVQGGNGLVRPNDSITRQEAFTVFARMFGISGAASMLGHFKDDSEIASWAREPIGGLVARGFVQGANGALRPTDSIKRCEVVKLLDNMITGYYTEDGTYYPSGSGIIVVKANVSLDLTRFTGTVTVVSGSVKDVTPEPEEDDSEYIGADFDTLRLTAREKIISAALPNAAEFAAAGKSICIPGQEIIERQQYENPIFGQVGKDAVVDENMIPYTEFDIGLPAIPGRAEATGIFALIEKMLAAAPVGYDIKEDEVFANFLAFAELYAPAAMAARVVETKTVYVVSTGADDILTAENDPDPSFRSSQPYRVYTRVIEVGGGELDALRVLDCIPSSSPFSLGPATYESFNALVYNVGINYEGVVVEYDRVPTDSVASYSAVENGRMRIGYYTSEVFNIARDARVYMVSTETVGSGWFATTVVTGVEEGSFEALREDWNDSIRAVFNDEGEIEEAYIFVQDGEGAPPANIADIQKFTFEYGVQPDDPTYGFDGVENPYAVNYALYNPTEDADNTSASDPDALYPLFVFFHGIGGGANKNGLPTNDAGIGLRYIQPDYQAQFETSTEGVHGAYVMLPRANETSSHDLSTQGWLHGYRDKTNPRYAMGDESYKGRPTQVAAVISDIKYLIDHENIDPNRIYIAGFSAGGYMTWQTLVQGGELFAAASPQGAAFFPEGSQLSTDYSEFELGFADKLLAVKDVPIWMIHARNDGTCAWSICPGDPVKDPANTFNGQNTLWGMVRSLSDGVSPIQGSPLTRVTIHNYLKTGAGVDAGQHSPMLMYYNNRYDDGLTTADGTAVTIFDTVYGVRPDGYNEANPSAEDKASTWAYGKNPDYSTATDWTGTFIDWLNACGDAKASK